ncbi:hypothetical protein [Hyphomonas pacifica]|uniref:Uncharacterized protein n=1 Tax=Hyphomonas pacifica TaxID=1280941 RepID=A0A062TZB0_9PROT|nr:hypothetical protein [Hyphomonas pacifica]KCZ48185.1 hypothetical protein HY2_16015 [Hyphomonas pacifica]RAN34240.1 hypothetical protein HY3_01150 [Hyphomonas pacifica]RAN35705.1 hypothetical protein HY11_13195 [Hyphomonas pacifica]
MSKYETDLDPQRREDLSEQRGDGETPGRKDTDQAGFRRGEGPRDGEHGFLRDDGQKDRPQPDETAADRAEHLDEGNNPVLMPRDGRHPNAPDTLNADKGAESARPGALKPAPDTQELEDAYSKNDPGVKTKD